MGGSHYSLVNSFHVIVGQSTNHNGQISCHSPSRSKWLPFKRRQGSSPVKQPEAPSSGQAAAALFAPLSPHFSSPRKCYAIASPCNQSQAAVASSPLCSPSKRTEASFISKKSLELSPRDKQPSGFTKAEKGLKTSLSLKASTPQAGHAGVWAPAGYNSPISSLSNQAVNDFPQMHTQAFSPPKHTAGALSLPNHEGSAVEQKHQVSPTCVRLSPQNSLRVMNQGHGKRAFIICANGNKRPRSSAVRDYPEGCGRNLHLKLHGELDKARMHHDKVGSKMRTVKDNPQPDHGVTFPVKQIRKDQSLGSSQEIERRHPVKMMGDMPALRPVKSPNAQKPHLSLKLKCDARSPPESLLQQRLKKSKVERISFLSRLATLPTTSKERTPQIDWLPVNHLDHSTSAERAVNLQVTKRCRGRPKGAKSAKKALILAEGMDMPQPVEANSVVSARFLVKRTLQEFDWVRRSLAMSKDRHQRPDLAAATILKNKGRWRNCGTEKIIGNVPGVEVGDQFSFRIEMLVIGLHRQVQGGIDYVSGTIRPEGPLATSIVASGGYEDDDDYGDTFIYTGQGGNNYKGDRRQACNQVLQRGNLALSNSFKERTPVRVIRGSTDDKFYTYDGLYDVIACWFQTGTSGFGVYQYKLTRRSGQPELGSSIVRFVG